MESCWAPPGDCCPTLTVGLPCHPPPHPGFLPRSLFCKTLALALLSSLREETVVPETGPRKPAADTGQRAGWEAAVLTGRSAFPREQPLHRRAGKLAQRRRVFSSAAICGDGQTAAGSSPCSPCEHALMAEMRQVPFLSQGHLMLVQSKSTQRLLDMKPLWEETEGHFIL